jgi:hypothetical protein
VSDPRIVIACRNCGSTDLDTIEVPADDMPAPPGALLGVADFPREGTKGWRTVCCGCGTTVMVAYDYGTIDLGLVRDSQLTDP